MEKLKGTQLCGPALDSQFDNKMPTRLPGNLNLSFGDVDGEALLLARGNLAVSSGAACTSTDPEPSHVLRAIGFRRSPQQFALWTRSVQ
jgi:cysteine desulfurase